MIQGSFTKTNILQIAAKANILKRNMVFMTILILKWRNVVKKAGKKIPDVGGKKEDRTVTCPRC
ncbi:hypothetical protein B6N25_09395 [Sphingobacteriales bacterium TSM_CSS]|nr:hypothetical protein B6N25_09395 [Sphingobacteriales bacterium TSM_CSS]